MAIVRRTRKDLTFEFPSIEGGKVSGTDDIGFRHMAFINSAASRVERDQDQTVREYTDISKLQYELTRRWIMHPQTSWNLTYLEKDVNGPIVEEGAHYREVALPRTPEVIDGEHDFSPPTEDFALIGLQLALHFYPQLFATATQDEADEANAEGNPTEPEPTTQTDSESTP